MVRSSIGILLLICIAIDATSSTATDNHRRYQAQSVIPPYFTENRSSLLLNQHDYSFEDDVPELYPIGPLWPKPNSTMIKPPRPARPPSVTHPNSELLPPILGETEKHSHGKPKPPRPNRHPNIFQKPGNTTPTRPPPPLKPIPVEPPPNVWQPNPPTREPGYGPDEPIWPNLPRKKF